MACKRLELKPNGTVVPFNSPAGPTEKKARVDAWLFWKGRCAFCGKRATETHHAGYHRDGFSFSYELLPCCRACHSRQHGYEDYDNDNQLDFWKKAG